MREGRFLRELFFLRPLSESKQHKADPTNVHKKRKDRKTFDVPLWLNLCCFWAAHMRAAAVYNQHTQRHLSAVFVPHRKKHIPLRFSEARCTGLLLESRYCMLATRSDSFQKSEPWGIWQRSSLRSAVYCWNCWGQSTRTLRSCQTSFWAPGVR